MKFGLWILILAVTVWSLDRDMWIVQAIAATTTKTSFNTNITTTTSTMTLATGSVITTVGYNTATITNVSTLTSTSSASGPSSNSNSSASNDTNCHTGGAQYGGGQWNYCNRGDPVQQRNTQDDTKDMNDKGANQSTMLGMAAIAAGMAMVAAGVALLPNPPTTPIGVALIAAGMALIAAGMAALAAASKMDKNANKAGTNANKLDNIAAPPYKSTISEGKGSDNSLGDDSAIVAASDLGKADLAPGNGSGIKIDPVLLRSGKIDTIFSDMEKKTGLNRDDFINEMNSGGNPLSMLSTSPALSGKPSASEANLQKMMDDTLAKGGLPNGQEVMDKLGLSAEDLGGKDVGPNDMNRGLASKDNGLNIDALFSSKDAPAGGPTGGSNSMRLSSDVQAALDRNGITGRSIFEMVHSQYVKKTPLMFGVGANKMDGAKAVSYPGLSGEKLDF